MTLPAVIAAAALVTSVSAGQPSHVLSSEKTVMLRACVQPGNHGSPGSLHKVEVVTPGGTFGSPSVLYWFSKNIEGFRKYPGSQVEVAGTIIDVLSGDVELKASDGVFVEVRQAPGQPNAAEADGGSPPMIVKAEVTTLRSLGHCP